ncbi:MAG: AMP-binding protein [Magnetococcales bacterium]|nr:AMP-binding protein [Magnetococcales bacterium]
MTTNADALAVIHAARTLTVGAWVVATNHGRQQLAEAGVGQGDRVVLWMEPSLEMAIAITSVWAAGGVIVLINTQSKAPQLSHVLETTAATAVIHSIKLPVELPAKVMGLSAAEILPSDDASPVSERFSIDSESFASIVFTSGSTGQPKGVVQRHSTLLDGAHRVAEYHGIAEADRLLCPVPWSFDFGFVQWQVSVASGATLIIPERNDLHSVCNTIEQQRPTVLAAVPALITHLMTGMSPFSGIDKSSLSVITSSGGSLPSVVLAQLIEQMPRGAFYLNYGLTETYRSACLCPEMVRDRPESIGRAIVGVDLIVVDDAGRQVPDDTIGELVHIGAGVAAGYWRGGEHPLEPLLQPIHAKHSDQPVMGCRTGDYGWRDSAGFFHFHGRRDSQLKVMGVRVSPVEVEKMLNASGLISQSAVFGQPHALLGTAVVAVVVSDGGDAVLKDLKKFARKNLPPHMMPQRWERRSALPVTRHGKIDYDALKVELTNG